MLFLKFFKQFESNLEKHKWLLILLVFALFLRIPSFFEPYWYGDEAIYLTIGHALNQGEILYKDIVDHKTPIIYYLARVDSQLNFRILLTLWMLASYSMFYSIANKISKNRLMTLIITVIFIVLTSIPLLEGLIPNGELFVIGFVLASLFILSRHSLWEKYFLPENSAKKNLVSTQPVVTLLISGELMGLAILTKVPAAFDAAGVLLLMWFSVLNTTSYCNLKLIFKAIEPYLFWLFGLLIPIIFSIIYFLLKNALAEYLRYGLLYNFHYVGTWIPESTFWFAPIWLSLKGKIAIATAIIVGLSLFKKHLSTLLMWSFSWSILSLVAATLSNRPYPHYLLQVVLPICLFLLSVMINLIQNKSRLFTIFSVSVLILLFVCVNKTVNFGGYSSTAYYRNFFRFATGKITADAYSRQFDGLVEENKKAAQLIHQAQAKQIYIWGTNPTLYAQSHTFPPDPFVVLFHLQDLNLIETAVNNVMRASPPIIVVMKNVVSPPQIFTNFLNNNYIPRNGFKNLTFWYLKQ